MSKIISLHTCIRGISFVLLLFLLLVDFLLNPSTDFAMALLVDFSCACAILLIFPTSAGNIKLSFYYSIACSVLIVLSRVFSLPNSQLILILLLCLVAYTINSMKLCINDMLSVLKMNIAWKAVELFSKVFYCEMLWLLLFIPYIKTSECLLWIIAGLSFILYVILYIRAYFAITLFISSKKESELKMILRADTRGMKLKQSKSDVKSQMVYSRLLDAMENKRMYLDPSLSLLDVSREVYCNKTYLSRVVNKYSGANFCNFVNSYRIKYAQGLMQKDNHLKVKEVAGMSGFMNIVSFNIAFKDNTGLTPTEYYQTLMVKGLRRPSNSVAREL